VVVVPCLRGRSGVLVVSPISRVVHPLAPRSKETLVLSTVISGLSSLITVASLTSVIYSHHIVVLRQSFGACFIGVRRHSATVL